MQTIGVLSLQGDFFKHKAHLENLNVQVRSIRYPNELADLDGLILPGGESTTIGKLMDRHGLLPALSEKVREGFPVFATCAGTILLAKEIDGSNQVRLGLLDITVSRNAYGRQVESFEADILFPELGTPPIRSRFIRAPIIKETGRQVQILGSFEDMPVLVREMNILAATFHPELTDDSRIHSYFIEKVVAAR